MANRYAVANGNWSATATWDGGTLPTTADDVYSNNFTVTIDGTFTVLTIRNTAAAGINAGGGFTFANGGDLTCTASNGVINRDTGSVYCLTFDLASPSTATLNASVSTAGATINGRSILVQNTGTFNMVGNYDLQFNNNSTRMTIQVASSATINITGNITCSNNVTSNFPGSTIWITGTNATLNITGNLIGANPSSNQFTPGVGNAIYASVGSTINITGNITTNGCPTVFLNAGGTLNVVGNTTGGNSYPAIYNATTAATIDLLGISTSGSGSNAVLGISTTFVKIRGNVVHTDTYAAIYAGRVVIDDNVTSWQFKDSTNTVTRTLYTAGVNLGNPAEEDVRDGVDYGANLELTGTLIVPNPANVLSGVATDDTTGTLLMTPEDFWNYLISSGFDSGSIGERLQNASTVATTGGQIASYNI